MAVAVYLSALVAVMGFGCAAGPSNEIESLAAQCQDAVFVLELFDHDGIETGSATAFLASAEGSLVTAYHVLSGAEHASALANDGTRYEVEGLLAADAKHDLAILSLRGYALPYLRIADPRDLRVGEQVVVIGGPLGLVGTVSAGIISARRTIDGSPRMQITAPISPGSSGSPVLDISGQVIGVVTSMLTKGQLVNIATPLDAVATLASRVTENTAVSPLFAPELTRRYRRLAIPGYSLTFTQPDDWMEKPHPPDILLFLSRGRGEGSLSVCVDPSLSGLSPSDLREDFLSEFNNTSTRPIDATLIDEGRFLVDEREAPWFTLELNAPDLRVKQVLMLVPGPDACYVLTFSGRSSTFDLRKRDFFALVSSISFAHD
jgi:hypothetical protein